MEKEYRVGVAGLRFGRRQVTAFNSLRGHFRVVAVCDIDGARAEAVAREEDVPASVSEFAELCRRDDIDIISICTPPFLHFEQISEALRAGRNVICEKPLVGSLAEVDSLMQVQLQTGHWVMPIFQYRYGSGIQRLKHLIDQGVTGPAFLATGEVSWLRGPDYYQTAWRGKWKTELGGTLLSHAIHGLDMVTHLLGKPNRVFAHTATLVNPIEVEDTATVSLQFPSGALASFAVTLGSSAELGRHRFCFRDVAATSNLDPYFNGCDPWTFVAREPQHQVTIDSLLADFQPEAEDYQGQFIRCHRALTSGAPLPVTLEDARNAIELVAACYESSRTGTQVSLPIDNTQPVYRTLAP